MNICLPNASPRGAFAPKNIQNIQFVYIFCEFEDLLLLFPLIRWLLTYFVYQPLAMELLQNCSHNDEDKKECHYRDFSVVRNKTQKLAVMIIDTAVFLSFLLS